MPSTNISLLRKSFFTIAFSILIPAIAIIVYPLDTFNPAPIPIHELIQPPKPAETNSRILKASDAKFLGEGQLLGPEDIAYDSKSGLIYTGCEDGWIKRVKLNDSVVEKWVNTGGRPLGIVLGNANELIVADAYKGLLKLNGEGKIEVLTDEAEGVKFKLTDGVDIAEDGIIYFTDASYKYDFHEFFWDILEGKPHGRVLSFDPATNSTRVLVRHLYFANGIAISPNQQFFIFCESVMRRCWKYYIKGDQKGQIENFINLPGVPDNIHYDGNGHFWIALSSGSTRFWDIAYRYPVMRKMMGMISKIIGPLLVAINNAGVLVVDVEGNPIAHYYDPALRLTSVAIKIGPHLYLGSIATPHILRLNFHKLN